MSVPWEKWLKQAKADKKKLAMVAVLAVTAAGMWGKQLFFSGVPENANAGSTLPALAPVDNTAAVKALPVVDISLPQGLERDLFAVNPALFNTKSGPGENDTSNGQNPGPHPAEDNRAAVAGMTLQSTILGETPRAVINGQAFREGEKVNGLMVKKIMDRKVILEIGGVEFKLEM